MRHIIFNLSLLIAAIILLTAPLQSRADSLTADVGTGVLVISKFGVKANGCGNRR